MAIITITDSKWFNKQNDLYIPIAVESPSSYDNQASPDNEAALNDLCKEVERELLLNALGLTVYNELQAAIALPGYPDSAWTADQKWKDIVNGCEYDGKVWDGLNSDKSFIAYAVYALFLTKNSDFYSPIGVVKPEAENSKRSTPVYKIASAQQAFIRKYQGGYLHHPNVSYQNGVTFTDYYGQNDDVSVSLYRFLSDNTSVYGWNGRFKAYETKNSWGI